MTSLTLYINCFPFTL